MRIVVTGGSGLVGSRIVRLLAAQHDVVNYDVRPPAPSLSTHVRGDILDGRALRKALRGADALVHAAAVPGPAHGSMEAIERINVGGTREVARAATAERVARIVFISSEAVLGIVFSRGRVRPRYVPIDEAHPLSPAEPYGRGKLEGETILEQASRSGPAVVCLRPPWVWVPDEYERCRELTEHPETWVDGLWAYVHGDDLAEAARRAATSVLPGRFHAVYVAATDNGTTVPTRELLAGHYPDVPVVRGIAEFESLVSSDGASRLLGFRPRMTWREFLA